MPQLDFYSYYSSAIYLAIIFLSLLFMMYTRILPKIARVFKIRKKLLRRNFYVVRRRSKVTVSVKPINVCVQQLLNRVKKYDK